MLSLEFIGVLGVAYAVLVFVLIGTRSARRRAGTEQRLEKDATTTAGTGR
jgi:hypothetical protein